MALIFDGSYTVLQEKAKVRLAEKGFSVTPGSVAKLLVSIVNSEVSDLYSLLQEAHVQSFLSSATGNFLDAIGVLLNCSRLNEESDSDYRYRISNQVLIMASSNEIAVRLAALSVEGVKDIYLKKYSHGAGSFTVIVISDYYDTPETLLLNVSNAIDETVAFGTKYHVDKPNNDYISMDIKLIIKEGVDDITAREIKLYVKEKVKEYINSLKLGGMFIVNELTQRIMEVSENIVTYSCTNFMVNNKPAMFVNQESRWSSRFVISPEPDAINIS